MLSAISSATFGSSAQVSLPSQSTEALKAIAASANDDKKIDKSAKDFEAILLGNMLQGAEDSFAKVPGTDDEENDTDSGGSQFLSMAMQSLGTSLSGSGGIGIAKMISQSLHRTEETAPQPAVKTSEH